MSRPHRSIIRRYFRIIRLNTSVQVFQLHEPPDIFTDFYNSKIKYVFLVEIKCQLDATEVFIADLTACSTCFGQHYAHHQELKSIIQWLLPVVFRAVVFKLLVWCGAEGYVSGLQDAMHDDGHSGARNMLSKQ